MNILIVDDDKTMVGLLKTLLMIEGFNCSDVDPTAPSPLENILAVDPDIVVMDVHLKSVDGIDLLKELRFIPRPNPIHVVMTSGLDRKVDCMQAGADAFLQKPYMPQDLIQCLRSFENKA